VLGNENCNTQNTRLKSNRPPEGRECTKNPAVLGGEVKEEKLRLTKAIGVRLRGEGGSAAQTVG